jgi:hypothetical protein
MKHMVPIQEYEKLKMHLNLLNRKHQSFRSMIVNSHGRFDQSHMQIIQMQAAEAGGVGNSQPSFSMGNFNPVSGGGGGGGYTDNSDQLFGGRSNDLYGHHQQVPSHTINSNDNLLRSLSPIKNEMVGLL